MIPELHLKPSWFTVRTAVKLYSLLMTFRTVPGLLWIRVPGKYPRAYVTKNRFYGQDEEGRNVGDSLLAIKPAALVLLVTTEQRLNNKTLDPVKPLLAECINGERPFYAISSDAPSVILSALEQAGVQMPVYYADIKTLLTMIRSTPGLMVLQDGVVNAKYAWRDFPSSEEWIRLINTDPELVVAQSRIHNRLRIEILALTVFLVIFLLRKGFWFSRRHM
jgi:hypothetical protein